MSESFLPHPALIFKTLHSPRPSVELLGRLVLFLARLPVLARRRCGLDVVEQISHRLHQLPDPLPQVGSWNKAGVSWAHLHKEGNSETFFFATHGPVSEIRTPAFHLPVGYVLSPHPPTYLPTGFSTSHTCCPHPARRSSLHLIHHLLRVVIRQQ